MCLFVLQYFVCLSVLQYHGASDEITSICCLNWFHYKIVGLHVKERVKRLAANRWKEGVRE